MAAIDDLIKQIQSQGTASKWSGGYGVDAATKDMAKLLADAGITDIKQFGKITQYEPAEVIKTLYNGQQVFTQTDENGKTSSYVNEPTGKMITRNYGDGGDDTYPETRMVAVPKDAKLENVYGVLRDRGGEVGGTYYEPVDPSKTKTVNGKLVADTGLTTFGNKETGQAVENKYETGSNAFGGTYEGKGNTGYRVDFTPDGTPVFYTTGASSSDLKEYAPLLAIAGLGLGAPMLGELFGTSAAGAAGAGMSATELAALDLALGGAGGSLGAAELGAALAGGASGGAGLLESVFDPTFGGELSPVIGGGAESVFDPTFGGTLSDVSTGAIPTASLTDKAVNAVKGLGVSDAIRLAGIGTALAGGAKLAGDAMGGSGGYPIVPVPTDWTSPIKPTGVAEFTPLAPIDFGNKEMLQGTQWEQLLSPDYGKTPAMPSMPVNPSNMNFDQLMGILGNTRTSMPTQNVSINDVIAGIQSQYGQTPTGSMG